MTVSTGWGGARTPSNPAVVSGPGAMSARTDGGVMDPNAPAYGENIELQNLQSAAPLAGTSGAAPTGGGGGAAPARPITPLGAPSADPRPVTYGAAAGPGAGPEALGLPMDPNAERRADARSLSPALLNALLAEASRADATPSFKRRVREVIVSL